MITVILPVYNAEKFLKVCLRSLVAQTFTDFKVLLIDDCSTDNSLNILKEFAEIDDRFEVVALPSNIGESGVMRQFMPLVSTKYTARMDADDMCHPQRFEKQIGFLEVNEHVDVLGTRGVTCPRGKLVNTQLDTKGCLDDALAGQSPILNPSSMWRTNSLRDAGIEFGTTWGAADYGMWIDCLIKGLTLANLPDVLVRYSKYDGQMTSNRERMYVDTLFQINRLYRHQYPQLSECNLKVLLNAVCVSLTKQLTAGQIKEAIVVADTLELTPSVSKIMNQWRMLVYPSSNGA